MTMVALASEAGVSRRLVYDHFPDRAALYDAFFEDRAARYLTAIDGAFAEAHGDPRRAAAAAFERLVAMPADDQRAVRLLVADPGIPDLAALRERFRAHVEARWMPLVDPRFDLDVARGLLWALATTFLSLADLATRGDVPRPVATALADGIVGAFPDAVRATCAGEERDGHVADA